MDTRGYAPFILVLRAHSHQLRSFHIGEKSSESFNTTFIPDCLLHNSGVVHAWHCAQSPEAHSVN